MFFANSYSLRIPKISSCAATVLFFLGTNPLLAATGSHLNPYASPSTIACDVQNFGYLGVTTVKKGESIIANIESVARLQPSVLFPKIPSHNQLRIVNKAALPKDVLKEVVDLERILHFKFSIVRTAKMGMLGATCGAAVCPIVIFGILTVGNVLAGYSSLNLFMQNLEEVWNSTPVFSMGGGFLAAYLPFLQSNWYRVDILESNEQTYIYLSSEAEYEKFKKLLE